MDDCCQSSENLIQSDNDKSDLIIRICKVCHKRHFELSVDKAELFGKITG